MQNSYVKLDLAQQATHFSNICLLYSFRTTIVAELHRGESTGNFCLDCSNFKLLKSILLTIIRTKTF